MIKRIRDFAKIKEERKREIREEIVSLEKQIANLEKERNSIISEIAAREVDGDKTISELSEEGANGLKELDSKIYELRTTIDIKNEIIKNIDKRKLQLQDSLLIEEIKEMKDEYMIKQDIANVIELIKQVNRDVDSIRNKIYELSDISISVTKYEDLLVDGLKEVVDSVFKELAFEAIREIDRFDLNGIIGSDRKLRGLRTELGDISKPINLKKKLGL